jgi:hypothetical protein
LQGPWAVKPFGKMAISARAALQHIAVPVDVCARANFALEDVSRQNFSLKSKQSRLTLVKRSMILNAGTTGE